MLKSCKYCGRVHEANYKCPPKKQAENKRWANRRGTRAAAFRRSPAWTNKSIAIRERDNYMCVCCKEDMLGTVRRYNTEELSVHHITPIEEDYDRRLDDDNLITVCVRHHEMCERGEIPRARQYILAKEAMAHDDDGAEVEIC